MKRNLVERSKSKKVILLFLIVIIIGLIGFLTYNGIRILYPNNNTTQSINLSSSINYIKFQRDKNILPNTYFNIEVANTESKREVGLMNRKSLDINSGMLFLFDSEQPLSFWMKNTFIPLDMIFIGSDKKINKVYKNTTPIREDLTYNGMGKYVLEINGGLSDKLDIKEGDTILLQSITY